MNDGLQPYRIDPELLAALADGELDAVARRRVLEWLELDPEALADFLEQERFSPSNADFWHQVAPPMPTAEQWNETLKHILAATPLARRAGSRAPRFIAAVVGVAASLLVIAAIWQFMRNAPRNEAIAPSEMADRGAARSNIDEELIIRMATDDDVTLIRLPESAASLVVVGRHPIEDNPLLLALAGDVELLNYSAQEPSGWPSVENSQGSETSMLWAPNRP